MLFSRRRVYGYQLNVAGGVSTIYSRRGTRFPLLPVVLLLFIIYIVVAPRYNTPCCRDVFRGGGDEREV